MFSIHIHLSYDQDPREVEARYLRGEAPDRYAYGFHHAMESANTVTYSVSHAEGRLTRALRLLLCRLCAFDLIHAWRNRALIDRAEVIWTMIENDHLATSLVYALRPWVRRRPILLAQCVWLYDKLLHRRMPFKRWLAARADVLMTHSEACIPAMRKYFPDKTPFLMHFGISGDSFPMTPGRPSKESTRVTLFAAGNDPTRDWATLLSAFGNDERFRLVLVCGWVTDADAARYSNVELVRNPSMAQFRQLYQAADLTVVPMLSNLYSGITVALESVAMGTPVVSARTGGVPTYFDETEVVFYEPQNAKDLKDRVLGITGEQRARLLANAQARFASSGYTTQAMVDRYNALSLRLLDAPTRAGGS